MTGKESVATLFTNSRKISKIIFYTSKGSTKEHIHYISNSLAISEGVEKYRKLIWESLSSLCEIEKYRAKVRKILSSYGGIIEDGYSSSTVGLKIYRINFGVTFPPDELENCLLVNRIVKVFSNINFSCESAFAKYF